ncbi:hypothetical protein [Methylosinus sp. Sm6]|uniref:hypothetical protein n=1 Tax=Methylosinus sp. Sm6 TaxID=2866948 RepID=UPI001C99A74D|nr:hypothetical protein [Methylosinus sp. Sm6]MBY6240397.1 hypothetical protein [Methylosinus sp. Sm6]
MRELVAQILVDPDRTDDFFGVLQRIGEIALEFQIPEPLVRLVQERLGDAVDPSGQLRVARFDLWPPLLEPVDQIDRRQMVASPRQLFEYGLALALAHGAVQLRAQLFDMLRVGHIGAPVVRSRGRIGPARGILGFGRHGMLAS